MTIDHWYFTDSFFHVFLIPLTKWKWLEFLRSLLFFFIERCKKMLLMVSNRNSSYFPIIDSCNPGISRRRETRRSARIIRVSLNRCRFEESDKSKWICLPQTIRFLLVSTRAAKSAEDFYGPVFMNPIGGPQSRTRFHNARSRPQLGWKPFSARTDALSNDIRTNRTLEPRIPLELRGELKLSDEKLQFEG